MGQSTSLGCILRCLFSFSDGFWRTQEVFQESLCLFEFGQIYSGFKSQLSSWIFGMFDMIFIRERGYYRVPCQQSGSCQTFLMFNPSLYGPQNVSQIALDQVIYMGIIFRMETFHWIWNELTYLLLSTCNGYWSNIALNSLWPLPPGFKGKSLWAFMTSSMT